MAEKYSQFTDQRAGVNPFVQQPHKLTVFSLLVVLVKAPFVTVAAALFYATAALAAALPVSLLARPLRYIFERAFARLLLATLGYFSIESVNLGKAQARIAASVSAPRPSVGSGDVLVTNRLSWLDVLVLDALYAPTFTRTGLNGGLETRTVLQALGDAVSLPVQQVSRTTAETVERQQKAALSGPLVVQPEGAPTNNKAILTFAPVCEELNQVILAIAKKATVRIPTVHVIGLRYPPPSSAAAGGAGNALVAQSTAPTASYTGEDVRIHALWVMSQLSNAAIVSRLPAGYDPQPADFAASAVASASTGSSTGSAAAPAGWTSAIRDVLVTLVRGSRAVNIDAAKYIEFRKAFDARDSGVATVSAKEE
jgi:hypothetical protein